MDLLTPSIGLIFWQAIIFLLLVFFLGKYAWKPILGSLKERETSIADALSMADKAKQEMMELKADNEKLLADARIERDNLLKAARTAANKVKDEAREDAGKISAKMIADAKLAITNEKKAALTEVKNEVAALSVQIAEKLLRKNLNDKNEQTALVNDFLKDINNN